MMPNKLKCVVCGGDHVPHPAVCDPEGMQRQIAKLGARTWNRLTRPQRNKPPASARRVRPT